MRYIEARLTSAMGRKRTLAGVLSEEQAGPFAALAALKGKMGEE